jgi:thiamine pyrophosphokinase
VIAVDSGYDHAIRLGLDVDLLVGDMDSIQGEVPISVGVVTYPTNKDDTDLALALHTAAQLSPTSLPIIGGFGGRLDHLFTNAQILGEFTDLDPRWFDEDQECFVLTYSALVEAPVGSRLSLVPLWGPAAGLTTDGLKWDLHDDTVVPGISRFTSNEIASSPATLSLGEGKLLVILS